MQRTVWDGDREVLEIRAPSADVYVAQWPNLMERDSTLPALPVHPVGGFVLDPNPYFGTVGYGYVGGMAWGPENTFSLALVLMAECFADSHRLVLAFTS